MLLLRRPKESSGNLSCLLALGLALRSAARRVEGERATVVEEEEEHTSAGIFVRIHYRFGAMAVSPNSKMIQMPNGYGQQ